MVDPQDKELDKIIKILMQLKETGFDGKLVIYVKETRIQRKCDIVTCDDLTEA